MAEKSLKELLEERKAQRAKTELNDLKAEKRNADRREERAIKAVQEDSLAATKLYMRDQLREYQQISVIRALSNFRANRSMLDASDMGLGKTRMCASFLGTVGAPRFRRILWLTSKTLAKGDTRKELAMMGLKVVPVNAKNFETVSETMDELYPNEQIIYITQYQSLGNMSVKVREEAIFEKYSWDCLVIDEVTYLKGGANLSGPNQIWKLTKKLIEAQPNMFRYFLSGTPVENHPREVWAYMHLFDPVRFPKLSVFEKTFCNEDIRGELKLSNEVLFSLLKNRIIRNTYESCGVELPPVTTLTIDCELEDGMVKDLMHRLKQEFAMWLDDQPDKGLDVTMVLEQLLRQRQVLCTGSRFNFTKMEYNSSGEPIGRKPDFFDLTGPFPKMDKFESEAFELINRGENVIVFCCFNDPLYEIKRRMDMFCRVEIIDGSTGDRIPSIVSDFQQNKIQILCINKMSGAHGLNLQRCDAWPGGASHVYHMDRWWNPAKEKQALGRVRRMNTNRPVFNKYLHVPGEVDDVMLALNEKKQAYADAVDDGITVTKSELRQMLGL